MIRIGYERNTYAEKRLFIEKCKNCTYTMIDNIKPYKHNDFFGEREVLNSSFLNKQNNLDLVHYFNQINFGNMPFVVTFETTVPRFWDDRAFREGVEILKSDTCRHIIAMSNATFKLQSQRILKLAPEAYDSIVSKTSILHPAQTLIPSELTRFDNLDVLKIIFVGNDFFRKGGVPMLQALAETRKSYPLQLTLITDLKIRDNVTLSTQSDIDSIRDFILQNNDWIKWYKSIPNEKVLELIAESHLGILPTLTETYGYSVLEMQAAGTPVITTDVRALPETNSQQIGWLINLPYSNRPALEKAYISNIYTEIREQLKDIMTSIIGHPSGIISRSKKSIEKILFQHNEINYSNSLSKIYEHSLNS